MSMGSNGNSSSVTAIIVSLIIIGLLFFTVYMINASRRWRYRNTVSARCISLNRQESSRVGNNDDSNGYDSTSITYNPEFSAMIDGEEHIFRGISWSSAVPKFAEGDVVTLRYPDGDLGPVTPMSEEEYNAKAEAVRSFVTNITDAAGSSTQDVEMPKYDGRVTYKNFYIEGYSKFKGLLATAIVAWGLAALIIVIITCT